MIIASMLESREIIENTPCKINLIPFNSISLSDDVPVIQ